MKYEFEIGKYKHEFDKLRSVLFQVYHLCKETMEPLTEKQDENSDLPMPHCVSIINDAFVCNFQFKSKERCYHCQVGRGGVDRVSSSDA